MHGHTADTQGLHQSSGVLPRERGGLENSIFLWDLNTLANLTSTNNTITSRREGIGEEEERGGEGKRRRGEGRERGGEGKGRGGENRGVDEEEG